MSNTNLFSPSAGDAVVVDASAASKVVQLFTAPTAGVHFPSYNLRLYNHGPNTVWVAFGASAGMNVMGAVPSSASSNPGIACPVSAFSWFCVSHKETHMETFCKGTESAEVHVTIGQGSH